MTSFRKNGNNEGFNNFMNKKWERPSLGLWHMMCPMEYGYVKEMVYRF